MENAGTFQGSRRGFSVQAPRMSNNPFETLEAENHVDINGECWKAEENAKREKSPTPKNMAHPNGSTLILGFTAGHSTGHVPNANLRIS